MNLSPEVIETYLNRAFSKYTLKQVDSALAEIQDLQKKFKKFNFKTHGLRMTAVEFFAIQTQIKNSVKFLNKRRSELVIKRLERKK